LRRNDWKCIAVLPGLGTAPLTHLGYFKPLRKMG
jgi:hypothetical protein